MDGEACPALPSACTCPPQPPGPPGPQGPPVSPAAPPWGDQGLLATSRCRRQERVAPPMPPGCEQAQWLPPGLLHTRLPLLKSPVLTASDAPPGTHSRSGRGPACPSSHRGGSRARERGSLSTSLVHRPHRGEAARPGLHLSQRRGRGGWPSRKPPPLLQLKAGLEPRAVLSGAASGGLCWAQPCLCPPQGLPGRGGAPGPQGFPGPRVSRGVPGTFARAQGWPPVVQPRGREVPSP